MKAVGAAWKDRSMTETFRGATAAGKKRILEAVEKEVMEKRSRKKIDANSKIKALNQRIQPGSDAVYPASTNIASNLAPIPPMAPPGYVPFPAAPIEGLMRTSRRPYGRPDPKVVAASRAAIAYFASEGYDSDLDYPEAIVSSGNPDNVADTSVTRAVSPEATDAVVDTSVSLPVNVGVTDAITTLKEQHEAERRRHEEEMNELKDVVHSMKNQMQQMSALLHAQNTPSHLQANNTPSRARRSVLQYGNHTNVRHDGYPPSSVDHQRLSYDAAAQHPTTAQHSLPPLRSAHQVHNYNHHYTDYHTFSGYAPANDYNLAPELLYSGHGPFTSGESHSIANATFGNIGETSRAQPERFTSVKIYEISDDDFEDDDGHAAQQVAGTVENKNDDDALDNALDDALDDAMDDMYYKQEEEDDA
jgi:hypothetical protein